MLAYFLATVMAIISLILYLNAFISPKIHRQDDFLWSGLGLFYALTLWVCSGRITGAVLLGQLAIIVVAIAFIWENRQLRKSITADSESNQVLEGVSILSFITFSFGKLSQLSLKKTTSKAKAEKPVKTKEKTDVVEKEKVTDSKKSNSPELKTESLNIVEEIITDIDASQKVENIIKEIANDSISDDSLKEDNIIEEIVNEETKTDENITPSLDESKIGENILDDDFDIDSLGLTESSSKNKPLSPRKTNIFSKLLGIFRKSSPQKISQPEELTSSLQLNKDDGLEENISKIETETTETEVEDAIANFDLSESNNISEDNQKIDDASPDNTADLIDKNIEISLKIVTSETKIIIDTPLEFEDREEEVSLLTDLESDHPDEEISSLTDLESDNQEGKIQFLTENTNTDLSDEINPQKIPQEEIIETLRDLSIETENITLDLESPSESENQNTIDELDSLFEDDVKNKQNQ